MWVLPILISCETSCSSTILPLSIKSSRAPYVALGPDASISFSEFLNCSMNGKTSLWSSSGVSGTELGL